MAAVPYARTQPYDNSAYVRAMADLMIRQGETAAAARLMQGQNKQQMWQGLGQTATATMASMMQSRDEEKNRRMIEAERDRDYALKQQEMKERAADRLSDQQWRQQQYEAEQKRYADTIAYQQAGDVGLDEPVSQERFKQTFAGHPAAGQFKTIPGQPEMPAWEAEPVGDAMADAGPATPATSTTYRRNPTPQESLALRSAALAEQDRIERNRQFTINQGQEEDRARQAQANADRAFNEDRRQFGVASGIQRDRIKADTAPLVGAGFNFGKGNGEEFLATLPPETANLVKSVANYQTDIKVASLRDNERMRLAQLVMQYDPTFDMNQYASRAALAKDFRSGKSSQNIRSLNTAVGHLDSFAKAATALDNSSWQTLNRVSNWWNGETGDPKISRLLTTANAVESELASVFKGTGATDQEIKEWRRNFNAASSPAQFNAVVESAIELMGSRLQALDYQYQTGMAKPRDFAILSPKSRKILVGLGIDPNTMEPEVGPINEVEGVAQEDWFGQQKQKPSPFGFGSGLPQAAPAPTRRPGLTFGPGQ